jgi:hypothetical protein
MGHYRYFFCEDFALWDVVPCNLMELYLHLQTSCPDVGCRELLWNRNTFSVVFVVIIV